LARWENVQELRNVSGRYDEFVGSESLMLFLESVALLEQNDVTQTSEGGIQVLDDKSESENRVTLMTLHAAKGLEFSIVFLAGLEEGLLPHMRALDEKFNLQEERRLCYVGITRAKQRLHVTYARNRVQFGSFTANVPSRFLKELPMEYVSSEQSPSQFDEGPYSKPGYRSTWFENNDAYEPDPLNPWEL